MPLSQKRRLASREGRISFEYRAVKELVLRGASFSLRGLVIAKTNPPQAEESAAKPWF
jgi:hypothetical protein